MLAKNDWIHALTWNLMLSVLLLTAGHPVLAATQPPEGYTLRSSQEFLYATEVSQGLLPYDAVPLKPDNEQARIPLILVHGIAPDPEHAYNWQLFLNQITDKQDFHRRYKIYFFVYNPQQPTSKVSKAFRETLQRFSQENDVSQVRVLALSLGGLLVRDTLAHPEAAHLIQQAITIGTPFHGTPLANPHWFEAQLKQESMLSPLRMSRPLLYKVVQRKFPHFQADYCWDNFDGALPTDLSRNYSCRQPQSLPEQQSEKLITYSSYFAAPPQAVKMLQATLDIEPTSFRNKNSKPSFAFRPRLIDKHDMMAMVSDNMANMPTGYIQTDVPSLMSLNDGVCPVSSHLWLGRYMRQKPQNRQPHGDRQAQVGQPDPQAVWEALKALKNTGHARLFAGLDHRDWTEGSTRTGSQTVQDLLHPDEPAKTVYDFLVEDLMRDTVVSHGDEERRSRFPLSRE